MRSSQIGGAMRAEKSEHTTSHKTELQTIELKIMAQYQLNYAW